MIWQVSADRCRQALRVSACVPPIGHVAGAPPCLMCTFVIGHHAYVRSQLPTWRSIALRAVKRWLVVVGVILSGVAWATAAVVGRAVADGYRPEFYDLGNWFAFFGLFVILIWPCPFASAIGYELARGANWSTWRSLAAAQLGAAIWAAPMFLLLQS